MTMREGGSYVKRKDGTLDRVEFTEPAPARYASKVMPDIRVRASFDERVAKPREHPLDHDSDGQPGGSKVALVLGNEIGASALADQAHAGAIDFNTLRINARRFLGDDVPRRKDDVIAALRAVPKE